MVLPLAKNGISSIIIDYDLAPKRTIYEIIEQIRRSLKVFNLTNFMVFLVYFIGISRCKVDCEWTFGRSTFNS